MVVALCIFNLSYPYLMKIRFNKCYKDDTFSTELSSKFNCHITTYIYNGKSLKDCNALVCGFIYSFNIYISDFLIDSTSKDELNAILLHEIGHIKKHNTLIKNAFLISSVPLMITIGSIMDEWEKFFGGIIFFLTIFFFYSVIFFFYISRKQEFEADKFAIDNGADTEAFSKALDKLADLNLFAKKRNFIEEILSTHPSTIKRITRLKDYHP